MPRHLVATGALALLLAACTPPGLSMNNTGEATPVAKQPKRNPAPQQAYRITMTIENAPGPFAQMVGLAQYDVVNTECLRPPKDNPGGYSSPVPTEDVEFPLKKVGENQYETIVYADQMLDEDYAGRGLCRWELIQARVRMKVSGAADETVFTPSISSQKILEQSSEVVHFRKSAYGDKDGFPYFGQPDRSRFGPSVQDIDLFTITFNSVKG